jgi:hypothetical protein
LPKDASEGFGVYGARYSRILLMIKMGFWLGEMTEKGKLTARFSYLQIL